MKKILYIDPLSEKGHINFNNIYIKSLYNYTQNVDFVFKEKYNRYLNLKTNCRIFAIPDRYYHSSGNRLSNRYDLWRIFIYIKTQINLNLYDFVILSSYEEIALYFSFFKYPLVLINHNNLRKLSHPVKLFFFRRVAKKNINIVFEKYMKKYLEKLGIENIYVSRHGLPEPLSKEILKKTRINNEFISFENYKYVIFSPSGSSSDNFFLNDLIFDNLFQSFLKKNHILLVIKGEYEQPDNKNIQIIDKYLTESQYQYLLLKSDIILIPYPKSHKYRVSAIFFECVANNKACLLSNIKAMRIYMKYIRYNPYFNDTKSLINRIDEMLQNEKLIMKNPFQSINELNVSLDFLFK